MERFIKIIAPRSWPDLIVRLVTILIAINAINILVEVALGHPLSVSFSSEALQTTAVSTPFALLALGIIWHQSVLQDRLAGLAATDVLTNLRNRRAFLVDATATHADAGSGALLMLDADYFKRINDNYGHSVGDICLQAIADRMRAVVRKDDIIGRLGGEEFAIYLPRATADHARAVGERLCLGIEVEGSTPTPLKLTLSAGASMVRASDSIEKIMTIADKALYEAKEAGRARLVFGAILGQVNLPDRRTSGG